MAQPEHGDRPGPSADGPATVVVLARLRAQVEELASHDPGVRRDAPDAVHRMRVASRRLRSALASFRPLLDRTAADELRAELKWLAGTLGEARDAEVMRDRLTSMAAAQPGGDAGEPLSVALGSRLDDGYGEAHARVLEALDSPRYFRLLDALDRLVAAPPWEPAAELPAREVLPGLVRAEWKRLARRVAAVERTADTHERDVELHEVRKAAKRLRYACEALILGRLHRLEQEHAEQSRSEFEVAWKELSIRLDDDVMWTGCGRPVRRRGPHRAGPGAPRPRTSEFRDDALR